MEVSSSSRGFQNKTPLGLVRENGTFFDAMAVFPFVGYSEPLELTAHAVRYPVPVRPI